MSHELEMMNGSVSYAQVAGEPAPWWDGMDGMQVTTVPANANRKQWMEAANFNFDITMHPMTTVVDGETMIAEDDPFMRPVRCWHGGINDGLTEVLGKPFTSEYVLVSPAHMLDFADAVIEASEGAAYLATLGSVRNGNRNFASVKLGTLALTAPNGFVDETDHYLSITNSYDGSQPWMVNSQGIRIVCSNTQQAVVRHLTALIKEARGTTRGNFISGVGMKLKHSPNIHANMERGLEAISEHFAWTRAYELRAARLMEIKVTKRQFEAMVKELLIDGAEEGQQVNSDARKLEHLLATWTVEAKERGGATAWSALNAFTDVASHYSPRKGTPLDATACIEIDRGFTQNASTNPAWSLIKQANEYTDRVLVKA